MESRSLLCRRIAASILDSVLYVLIAACLNQLINDAINARFPNAAVALQRLAKGVSLLSSLEHERLL